MKILVCGAGAIGSNLVAKLASDLKGQHEITVLDFDVVEERNVTPGTQFYTPDQVGTSKVEALQYNIYKWYQREIEIVNKNILDHIKNVADLYQFNFVIDCFDNTAARQKLQSLYEFSSAPVNLLHVGFSDQFTFAIEWAENYKVPSNITSLDICELPGAAAFVGSVSSVGALVAEEFILNNKKIEVIGGKFNHKVI